MWNRLSGKSNDTKDDVSSQSTRRNRDESVTTKRHSGSGLGSVVSSRSDKKSSSRGDDRDRGFNPTSTSYSSTSKSPYSGTASASVASSYATASGKNDDNEPYVLPGLVRNASLADQMPKSRSSRSLRDGEEDSGPRTERRRQEDRDDDLASKDRSDRKREKREKGDKKDKDRGLSRSESGFGEGNETSRGPADFPDQVGSVGFSQFPGQYDGAIPDSISVPPDHPSMSSHVQDQFPGQFPTQSTEPYRPPVAASEGGPGLAAEYYGDAGQSVHEQPGFRKNSPSMIVNAEPHLQPALVEAKPPPEPSASGGVGAAASFFSGNFEEDETATSHGQHAPSTYTTAPSRPDVYHSSSAPAIPTIGGVAMGPAAGYFMGSQTASYQQRPDDVQSVAGVQSEYASNTYQRPPSEAQDSYYSNASRPSKPGKSSSHSSNIPMYAAGAAGAAGLAAAAYQQSHHSSSQHASSMAQHPNHSQHPTTQMAPRHRHRGPFGALIDFFQDPDGVAQFEEYSEITGICKYCFEPGSSPRDAPRRHRYRKRRSNERLGSSTRVEKDSRYYSSESENRRNKDKSWLATGLTGYGLGKVGETLFKQQNEFDDSYSVKTGRYSPDGRSHKSRRRSRSQGRVETGITSDGKIYKKDPRGGVFGGPTTTTYSTRRPSKSRSRSRDRKSTLTEAALGTAIGASVAGSTSKRRSDSPKGAFVKTSHQSRSRSLEKRRRSHKKKKEKGFFSFGGSSSSSIGDLGGSEKHGSSKRSSTKSKDDKKAEAALLGLGAAAAALALNDSRQGHKQKGVKELVGRKETRDKYDHGSRNGYKPPKVSSRSSEDEGWESAIEEDHGSVDLGLAYGVPARRGSRESLSSESSGTNKWGWRWGSKKQRRGSPPKRKFPDHSSTPAIAGAVGAGLAGKAMVSHDQYSKHGRDSTTSDLLQHVFPVPTSDPGRFDVGREDSVASSSRPGAVPIQHPQPVTPVSAALYSSQAPHEHCYSAPTGPPVFSQPFFQPRPNAIDARYSIPRHVIPGGFPQDNPQIRDAPAGFKLRRRDTSPARFGIDSVLSSMNPSGQFSAKDDTSTVKAGNESVVSAATSSRRFSTKDDSSAVRFAQTEEQEEEERRERRRKRKEEKLRREAEEQEQIDRDRKGSGDKRSKYSDAKPQREEGTEKDSEKSWPAPAALGIAGAAIGVATAMERSKSEETRDERRERRRREREEEEAEEEEKSKRRERRRKERDRDREVEESASKEGRERRDDVPEAPRDVDQQEKHAENEENSVSQKAPSAKYNHENYGDFFTPIELRNKPTDQVKVTSANADADVDLDRSPNIVATGSKVYRDLNALPEFSKADTNDQIDLSRLKFPWQIPPRLRLMEPTPPSTRGSTPVIGPKSASDDEVEPIEPKPSTLRGVTWGDDQTHEYTVITPHDEREEFIESPDDSRDRDRAVVSRATEKRKTSSDRKQQEQPINGATPSNGPTSYGDDLEFAATLAASAEDAGFDPSIVMDDPTYRRRDSPPGSNDRSMPGGFDDEDEPRLSKKERKKKDKAARLQSEDEPNGQDDDAVVRDIVSRIEDPEPQDPQSDPVNEIDDGWDSGKKSKSKKSKKGRKDSESRDEFYETSESPSKSQDAESRQVYHSPTEEAQSVVSGTNASNDGERSKKSRKKSKRDSGDYDDAASPVSSRIRAETDDDKSKEKKKGSIWSRVLGKSTDSLPQENGAKNVSIEAALEDFEEPKKKKKSKEHRSTRDDFDDNGTRSKSSTTSDRERRRRSSGGSTAQDSGRIAQDLPTKDRESSGELEQVDEQRSESFLGERPDPPPPPDIREEGEQPPEFESSNLVGLPATPQSPPDDRTRQYAEFQTPDPLRSPIALPSPTAVPFHRHRPRPPSGSGRSLSQIPLSSPQITADLAAQQKPRPRSTEFKSSKEFRPLWLVEKNMPRQEPALDETYPSLPSSHTTSRASSVHDSGEDLHDERGDYEMTEAGHEPIEGRRELSIYTHDSALPSDLLDSQQATPTASTFQHSAAANNLPSLPASRSSSPTFLAEENAPGSCSTLRDAALGVIVGGTAAYALHKVTQSDEPSRKDLSRKEAEQFQQGLDHMAPDSGAHQSSKESHSTTEELPREENDRIQGALDDGISPGAEADRSQDLDAAYEEGFAPRLTKKGKKSKRKASQAEQTEEQSVTSALEAAKNKDTKPKPMSPEELRQLQERDAQDAVESWFEPDISSKKDKKKKRETGIVEEPSEELAVPPAIIEPRQDPMDDSEPKHVRENNTLAQDMPRDQVANIMAAAARGENGDEAEITKTTRQANEAPIENLLLRRQSKSKGKKGKKVRKNTLGDDMPPRPPPSTSKSVQFIDPFSQRLGEGQSQSRQAEPASEEDVNTIERQAIVASPRLELSPMATPLPFDDDLDLIEEQPRNPIVEPEDRKSNYVQESLLQEPSQLVPIEEDTAALEQPIEESRDLPSQLEQDEADDFFSAPAGKKEKKGKKSRESFPTDTSTKNAIDEETLLPESTSGVTADEPLQAFMAEPALDVPQEESQAVGDDRAGFSSKKKGKMGKKSKPRDTANSDHVTNAEEVTPFPDALPAVDEQEQDRDLINGPAVDFLLEENNVAEDAWGGFSMKTNGKNGKKANQSFTEDPIAGTKGETEPSLLPATTPQMNTDQQSEKLVEEPVLDAPQEESREGDDEPIELGESQPRQEKDGTPGETALLATTTTSQDVSDMLRQEEAEASTDRELDETFIDAEAHEELQEPLIEQRLENHDRYHLPEVEPKTIVEPSETRYSDYVAQQANVEVRDSIAAPMAATTDTAQDIQNMLRNDDPTPALLERQDEPERVHISSAIGEASVDNPFEAENDEPDWDAPKKKKKGKKGKKSNVFSFKEPESTEPMGTSTPPVERSLEGESEMPVMGQAPMEKPIEDEPDWAAPKKTKKGKKGRKSEVFSFEEQEKIESTGTSTPSIQIEPSAEREPTISAVEELPPDQPIEEEQLDLAALKKTKKTMKGRKSEVFSIEEPDDKEPSGESIPPVEAFLLVKRELGIDTPSYREDSAIVPAAIEEASADKPIEEAEPDWAAPERMKGKKSKISEVFSFDEPEGAKYTPPVESAPSVIPEPEIDTPRDQEYSAINTTTTQEPATEPTMKVAEPDWDAPIKKKGKKGKKSQVFSLDDLENSDFPIISTPPLQAEPRMVEEPEIETSRDQGGSTFPSAQPEEPVAEQPVEEAEPDWIAPKKKEGKKSKKNQIFAFENSESQITATPAVEVEPSAVEEPETETPRDQDESAVRTATSEKVPIENLVEEPEPDWDVPKKKKGKTGKKNQAFSFDDLPNSESTPFATATVEAEPLAAQEPVVDEADDFPSMKSNKDKKGKNSKKSEVFSFDEPENVKSVGASTPPVEVEPSIGGADEFSSKKSRKDKKSKKRGLSRTPGGFDDANEDKDNQIPGVSQPEAVEAAEATQYVEPIEAVESTDPVEEQVISDKARELGPSTEEDFLPPKSKKDKKKSKKSKALLWDEEGTATPEVEPVPESRSAGEAALDQSLPLDDAALEQPEGIFEVRPKSKKDRKKFKKSKPFSLDEDVVHQAEQEASREPDAPIKPTSIEEPKDIESRFPAEPIMPESDGKALIEEYHESELAQPTSAESSKDISSTPLLSGQEPIAPEDLQIRQAKDSKARIDPTVDTEEYTPLSLKKSKKDKKKGEKANASSWEEPGAQEQSREVSDGPANKEGPNAPTVVSMPQDSGDWSPQDQRTEVTEPTEVVEPGEKPFETQSDEGSMPGFKPSAEMVGLDPLLLVDQDDDLAPLKKSKKDKKKRKAAQKAQDDYDTADSSMTSGQEATRDFLDGDRELSSDARNEAFSSPEKDSSTPVVEVEMLDEKEQREYDRQYSKELDRQHLEDPQASESNLPASVVDEEIYLQQEQPEYCEHYAEADIPKLDTLTTPATDSATPAIRVEMLDPQEQREYDSEYAKELERQLSPLQDAEQADSPPQADEAREPSAQQPSIDMVITQPIMERPYEDIHRPLAQPPGLEDITEESRYQSGSVQGSSADREDDFSPVKITKRSKKGKKGKKQQQPVVWEDETATPPMYQETAQVVDTPTETTDLPGSWETGIPNRPIDLEEHIEHEPVEMTPSAERGPSTTHDDADDYFGIQPSRVAEKDVGMQRPSDLDRSMSTEQPRAQSPRWEQHPGQVEHIYHDEPRTEDASESIEPSLTDLPVPSRVESIPTEELVDDNFSYAPPKKSKKGKKSKRRVFEDEPSSANPPSAEHAQQSSNPQISTDDLERQRFASREPSLQRPPHDYDDQTLEVEERARSESRSRSTEGLAAAAGLGLGAVSAEGISKRDSKKEGKKGKKSEKSTKGAAFEEEPREPEASLDREKAMTGYQEQDSRRDRHRTPPLYPPAHPSRDSILDEPDIRTACQPTDNATYRDSAILVSDSPAISDDAPTHRFVRDSGYPDTETSPIVDIEPQHHYMHAQRHSGDLDDGEFEENIIDQYHQEPLTRTPGPSISNYETSQDPENLHDGETEQEVIDEYDKDPPRTDHGRSDPDDVLKVSVEADPSYDVSISRPTETRRHSRRRSGAAYDSDDSADSGFDIRRRRRLQAKAEAPREPSPVSSTTKERTSALFGSSPSAREERPDRPREDQSPSRKVGVHEAPTWSFGRAESPRGHPRTISEINRSPFDEEKSTEPSAYQKLTGGREQPHPSLFGGPVSHDDETMSRSMSPPSSNIRGRHRLNTISEDDQKRLSLHKNDKRAKSDVGTPEAGVKERRMRSPPASGDASGRYLSTDDLISSQPWPTVDEDKHSIDFERSRSRGTDQPLSRRSNTPSLPSLPAKYGESDRKTSNASAQSDNSIHAIIRTQDQVRSASGQSFRSSGTLTPPLRRVDRSASGDLRGASKLGDAKTPRQNSEAEPDINIAIPSSSTYDPVTHKGKNRADMADIYEGYGNVREQSPMSPTRPPSMRKRQSMQLLDLETRLDQLVSENRLLQSQKSTAERSLQDQARDHSQQRHAYEEAMQEHKMFLSQKDSELNELKHILEEWQSKVTHLTEVNEELSSRGLDEDHHQKYRELETEHADLREQHSQLSSGMETIVAHEVSVALEEKNLELRQLRNELDNAKQQVRNLQQRLLQSRASDDFVERDDDYFDGQCQALCQHVQQWVLRFSKFSDMKACYRASEVRDEKVVDRMENALLDGTDFDEYLQDRVKRRDVFMSVVMTMIWEFVFTRYLFGMDREQRQKLKNLEKTLQEVGPMPAVHKWRATTLTLLMKRQSFETQRETDTEAVVQEIHDTLSTFLPPPSHLINQIQDSLRKVINEAVDLSIEMRTQRADYQMLPPLVPEYDTNGDLVGKVRFNALTMNERSGTTSSNEALEEQEAVVRMVLFPLVVRTEEDDEQIVVCPAQVLTAQSNKGKKSVRVMSAQGGRSEASFGGTEEGGMI